MRQKDLEGHNDRRLKYILDQNACPTALDQACSEVHNYLASKNGNQALLLPPIQNADSSSSKPLSTMTNTPQKWKNLIGFVDLPVTPEQATRANFILIHAEHHPLKTFAIIIHLIVSDAANIEHYFFGLGGVQSTFESLSKLHQFLAQSL
ncbi:hypothetical protein BDR07DRAFT_1439318 [Suillus spraguei]|nr:hypothetical protein BDR07DRAFT_1439318 [Suillus spraguei]